MLEPKPKRIKPNPVEERKATSNWQEDPRTMSDLPQEQQHSLPEYRRHWHQIRTRFSRHNRLSHWYNFRLTSLQPREISNHLDEIFTDQSTVFKVNVSFAFFLRNNEIGELQYYYASRNNEQVFPDYNRSRPSPSSRSIKESRCLGMGTPAASQF